MQRRSFLKFIGLGPVAVKFPVPAEEIGIDRFQAKNHEFISGGLDRASLEFFEANTVTPMAVFSDATLKNCHTNPVMSYSDGSFPPIYLGKATDYRIVLTDSNGIVLRIQDNVKSIEAGEFLQANH